jgi:glycosyltransferase involved in cell wall biosynthesis
MGLSAPVPLSGIYFGPTFHYQKLGLGDSSDRGATERTLREKFVLVRALRHPRLHRLFFLDPLAARAARRFPEGDKAAHLPDPVRFEKPSASRVARLRSELGIDAGRKIFLLFGHLTPRKGVEPLLAAFGLLEPELCRRCCLVLAGKLGSTHGDRLRRAIGVLAAERPVQVVERFDYVAHDSVPVYMTLADVVLAPYPRHAGMSGVLLLAAAAGRPILSSGYGLMGELVRRHRLGLTVDAGSPEEIALALERCLERPTSALASEAEMRAFAERHDASRFAAKVLSALRRPSGSAAAQRGR